MDIIPAGFEKECRKKLKLHDTVKVVIDSQFDDSGPRCFGKVGEVIETDHSDEWAYKIRFIDGSCNWFKRYILQLIS